MPPGFWYRRADEPPPIFEKILDFAAPIYRAAHMLRQNIGLPYKSKIPVICIGNLNVGGAGKTPSALALMDIVKREHLARAPFFLSRGYGGAVPGPMLVNPAIHSSWNVGDEALILGRIAPTVIAHDRAKGAELAEREGADMILMDDGFQNPGLAKDISIVVINGEMGFGNLKTLPAGPLRETLKPGLDRADAFILIGADKRNIFMHLPPGKPLFRAEISPESHAPPGGAYIAFAGIGHPEKFFGFLRAQNYDLAETVSFADHYPYTDEDMNLLLQKSDSAGAVLITTRKDFLRIPEQFRARVHVIDIVLNFTETGAVHEFLKTKIDIINNKKQ